MLQETESESQADVYDKRGDEPKTKPLELRCLFLIDVIDVSPADNGIAVVFHVLLTRRLSRL